MTNRTALLVQACLNMSEPNLKHTQNCKLLIYSVLINTWQSILNGVNTYSRHLCKTKKVEPFTCQPNNVGQHETRQDAHNTTSSAWVSTISAEMTPIDRPVYLVFCVTVTNFQKKTGKNQSILSVIIIILWRPTVGGQTMVWDWWRQRIPKLKLLTWLRLTYNGMLVE